MPGTIEEILLDTFLAGFILYGELSQHACEIATVADEKLSGIRRLKIAYPIRIQAVETHP